MLRCTLKPVKCTCMVLTENQLGFDKENNAAAFQAGDVVVNRGGRLVFYTRSEFMNEYRYGKNVEKALVQTHIPDPGGDAQVQAAMKDPGPANA